jgi:hypothetical protein
MIAPEGRVVWLGTAFFQGPTGPSSKIQGCLTFNFRFSPGATLEVEANARRLFLQCLELRGIIASRCLLAKPIRIS